MESLQCVFWWCDVSSITTRISTTAHLNHGVDTQGASNQFNHLLVVVKHLEPLLGIEGVAEHPDVALLQPILGIEELQPNLSVTGKQLVDATVLLANGVEGRAL